MPESDAQVSVIVRSMARPTPGAALASIASPDYPEIEVLVVAALGATHPAVGERCGVHRPGLVVSDVALPRAIAANAGLAAARGDWITFLALAASQNVPRALNAPAMIQHSTHRLVEARSPAPKLPAALATAGWSAG